MTGKRTKVAKANAVREDAYRALYGYERQLMNEAAERIVAERGSLHGEYGSGEAIVERYGHLLLFTHHLLGSLAPPSPEVRTRVKIIEGPWDELETLIEEWLDANSDRCLVDLQIVPDAGVVRAVLRYEERA